MSDISDTLERYKLVCRELEVPTNDHIMKVLLHEQDEAIMAQKSGTGVEQNMHLYVAGNNKLLTKTHLTDDDALVLYKCLRNNLFVTSLDLRYNDIGDEGAAHIAALIEETATLKDVNLMCNDFGEVGAQHLAKAIQNNETVTSLRLNGNKIGNKGGMYLAQALQVNTTLEALDLGDTDQKTESVVALATVLNFNTTLKSLNVNRPLLFSHQEETTVHFANMLKVNRTLQELHLMKYDMRDFGATRLAENLTDNFTLTYLNLSCNRITSDGARELAKLLRRDTPLKVLDLGYNRLGDDGAIFLSEALLAFNTHLTTLVLVSNEIRGKGLCAVADCLKMNTSLSDVSIWGNELEESACIAFSGLVSSGRLEEEHIDVKPYVVDGEVRLSQVSHGLRQWYLWGPSYGPNARPELAKYAVNKSC